MSPKITDRTIRAMLYDTRLRHYEREKNDLFYKIASMSAAEVAKAHADLAKKWRV